MAARRFVGDRGGVKIESESVKIKPLKEECALKGTGKWSDRRQASGGLMLMINMMSHWRPIAPLAPLRCAAYSIIKFCLAHFILSLSFRRGVGRSYLVRLAYYGAD